MAQREENIVEEKLRNADNRMTLFEALEIKYEIFLSLLAFSSNDNTVQKWQTRARRLISDTRSPEGE
jgi:hypothetical protein